MGRGASRALLLKWTPSLLCLVLRGLYRTIRWTKVNDDWHRSSWMADRALIFALWHGRMAMSPFFYKGRGLKILISRHADGELISRVLRRLGIESIRGSSTRGGPEAFRELIHTCKEGIDVAITPDGPRGPKYVVQKGVIELARLTRLPIVPFTYSTRHRHHSSSWDDFLIPRPFTRGVAVWGQPIWVDHEAAPDEQEANRHELETRLRRLTEHADAFFDYQINRFPA